MPTDDLSAVLLCLICFFGGFVIVCFCSTPWLACLLLLWTFVVGGAISQVSRVGLGCAATFVCLAIGKMCSFPSGKQNKPLSNGYAAGLIKHFD